MLIAPIGFFFKVDDWADASPMQVERSFPVMTKVGRSSRWFVSSLHETTTEIWQDGAWSYGPDSESKDNQFWGKRVVRPYYYTNSQPFCQVALNDDVIFIGSALSLSHAQFI